MSPRAACRLAALGFDRVYDYMGGIADWKAAALPTEGEGDREQRIIDATRTDVPTCRPDEPIREVRTRTLAAGWDMCVVTDCHGLPAGRLRAEAFEADADLFAGDVMEPGPSTVRPDGQLKPLFERMRERHTPNVIVTTAQGRLLGILLADDAERLLAGEAPERMWQDCDGCPGRWTRRRVCA